MFLRPLLLPLLAKIGGRTATKISEPKGIYAAPLIFCRIFGNLATVSLRRTYASTYSPPLPPRLREIPGDGEFLAFIYREVWRGKVS